MPTIKQLIRNTRQPIRNVTKSPALRDALSDEEHVLGCMCDSLDHRLRHKKEILLKYHGSVPMNKIEWTNSIHYLQNIDRSYTLLCLKLMVYIGANPINSIF